MSTRLEHANLIVRDIDSTVRFLQTAFPEFKIRFDSLDRDPDEERWMHIGSDETYIALTQATVDPEQRWKPYSGIPGVNHLGYEVDDVVSLGRRLEHDGSNEESAEAVERPRA